MTRIIKDNDKIAINLINNEINLLISNDEIVDRFLKIPPKCLKVTGYLNKFSKLCGSFESGYLTN